MDADSFLQGIDDDVLNMVVNEIAQRAPSEYAPQNTAGTLSFQMPHSDAVIVLIPAKNEAANVGQVIAELRQVFAGKILVIDDASTDNTAQVARQAGADVMTLCASLGAWGAMQTGLRYAQRHSYQLAITMDADGQHEAASLLALQMPVLSGEADVVIGACPQRGSGARQLAWALFRWLAGITLEDLTSGLRAYGKPAIQLLASPRATLLDYQDLGVLLLLHGEGLRIQETPISMRVRLSGRSRIFGSWWAVARYMLYTITLCVARGQHLPIIKPRHRTPS